MPQLIRQQITLTASQIRGAFVTPVNIVAPQTPNGIVIPVQCLGMPRITAPFTGAATCSVAIGTNELNVVGNVQQHLNNNRLIDFLGGGEAANLSGIDLTDLEEQPMRLSLVNELTDGTGDIVIVTLFAVIYPSY